MTDFRPATLHNFKLGVGQCSALPGYKLGIAAVNSNRRTHLYDELMNIVIDRDSIRRAVKGNMQCFIEFNNGSMIDVFVASDNARGKKFDEVIIETDIPQNIIWNVMANMIVPWQLRPWRHGFKVNER